MKLLFKTKSTLVLKIKQQQKIQFDNSVTGRLKGVFRLKPFIKIPAPIKSA